MRCSGAYSASATNKCHYARKLLSPSLHYKVGLYGPIEDQEKPEKWENNTKTTVEWDRPCDDERRNENDHIMQK